MRRPVALSVLALMAPLLAGCGQASNPDAGPGPKTNDQAAGGVNDATKILKEINEAIKSADPAVPGLNHGMTQVGSHRLKTSMDVSASTSFHDERAVVSFGGQTLTVEFDRGRVLLDDAEKAKLPSGTKEVEVHFVGGKLSVKADGTDILTLSASE